jgi:hypothetical protein
VNNEHGECIVLKHGFDLKDGLTYSTLEHQYSYVHTHRGAPDCTLTRPAKNLCPVDYRVAFRVNGISGSHFGKGPVHDIGAMAGA